MLFTRLLPLLPVRLLPVAEPVETPLVLPVLPVPLFTRALLLPVLLPVRLLDEPPLLEGGAGGLPLLPEWLLPELMLPLLGFGLTVAPPLLLGAGVPPPLLGLGSALWVAG